MKYTVDPAGVINLIPSIEEIDILSNALASKNLQLRKANVSPDTCNHILTMLATLNLSRVESTKNVRKSTASKVLAASRRGFWTRVLDFLIPPFGTIDFDNAESFCGSEIFITSMDFHPDRSGYPFSVAGYVKYKGIWVDCTWNAHGKCQSPLLGGDSYLFDLLRPSKLKTPNNSRSNSEVANLSITQ
jgi:hypothetical protein